MARDVQANGSSNVTTSFTYRVMVEGASTPGGHNCRAHVIYGDELVHDQDTPSTR